MYASPSRSIEKALAKFKLVDGQGNGKNTACAMTMLGWLAGHEKWSDNPICAHDTLSELVIEANDENHGSVKKAEAKRARLVKLGYEGVLDTWWIPDSIIEWATETSGESYDRAVETLKRIAKWKKTRHRMAKITVEQALVKELKGWHIQANGRYVLDVTGHYIWERVS